MGLVEFLSGGHLFSFRANAGYHQRKKPKAICGEVYALVMGL